MKDVLDIHVHIVGDGSSGSGCWIKPRGLHTLLARSMLFLLGMPQSALRRGLDEHYVSILVKLVAESSITRAVILAHDLVYTADGKVADEQSILYVPNDYVLALAKAHPQLFLPGVSIHPFRSDAIDELERCVAEGAALMKCLPNCQAIDCNDVRLRPFWTRMADLKLPLLAHTGGEHTLPVLRPELSSPRTLALPLECGVTVIAAHSATNSGLFDRDFFPELCEMCGSFKNLFADISAFQIPIRSGSIRRVLDSAITDRLVHGSDFPVPILGHWAWMRGLINWHDFRHAQQEKNPLERDYMLKLACGFAPEVFTRAASFLRV